MCWENDVFYLHKVDGENIYIENSSTSKILGVGKDITKDDL